MILIISTILFVIDKLNIFIANYLINSGMNSMMNGQNGGILFLR